MGKQTASPSRTPRGLLSVHKQHKAHLTLLPLPRAQTDLIAKRLQLRVEGQHSFRLRKKGWNKCVRLAVKGVDLIGVTLKASPLMENFQIWIMLPL